MAESGKSGKSGGGRQQRLAQALRENLRRRKAQARGRAQPQPSRSETGPKSKDK
jgi:hypothetical protein